MSADFSSLAPLEGGRSGETFVAEAGGERSVVRIYARPGRRGAEAQEVDAALLRLVRGLLPVPEVLEVRRADPATGLPALLVTTFLPGERGDLLLPRLDAGGRERVGARLGDLVADLGGMPMLAPGPFVDGRLGIGTVTGDDGRPVDGLPAWVELHERLLGWWTSDELDGLREVAVEAQARLDTVPRHCLVHGDLSLENVLLDPVSLEVAGLVDWERAHAGHPFTDLGSLLRLERDATVADAALTAYVARRGGTRAGVLGLARAADLWALVELATRRGENPVAERADRLLRLVATRRDPGAWEPGV